MQNTVYAVLNPAQRWPGKERTIWLVAILVSILLHGLLLRWRIMPPAPAAAVKEKIGVTRISFRTEIPARAQPFPAPPPRQIVEPLAAPVVKPKPNKVAKAKPVVKRVFKPVAKPQVAEQPPPVVKPRSITASQPEQREIVPPVTAGPPVAEKNASPPPQASPPAPPVNAAARQQFLQELFSHIEAHKYYPAMARRRRMEGQVLVSFTLLADGGLRDLRVAEGPSLLQEAARKSVQRAQPLPLPGGGVPLPLGISFRMDFRLR